MTTKEKFIERFLNQESEIIQVLNNALQNAVGKDIIDWENADDNYLDVYPLIAAVLKRQLDEYISNDCVSKQTRNTVRRRYNKYLKDPRIWHNYWK